MGRLASSKATGLGNGFEGGDPAMASDECRQLEENEDMEIQEAKQKAFKVSFIFFIILLWADPTVTIRYTMFKNRQFHLA